MTEVEQVKTVRCTTEDIMNDPDFWRGFEDARKGRSFDWRIDEWSYERGRLFAYIAPLDMPLWIDSKLNPKAVALYRRASARRLII
jgi:hypothetical protein